MRSTDHYSGCYVRHAIDLCYWGVMSVYSFGSVYVTKDNEASIELFYQLQIGRSGSFLSSQYSLTEHLEVKREYTHPS